MSPPDTGIACEAVLELMEELLDGELATDSEQRVRQHLEACPECTGELELATTLRRELRGLPELDAPAPLLARILAQTEGRKLPDPTTGVWAALRRGLEGLRPHPSRWVVATLAAAALAVLVLMPRSPVIQPDPASEPDLAQAILEARFALAYLGDLGRGTGMEIRDDVLRDRLVAPTVRGLLGSPEVPDPDTLPHSTNGGGDSSEPSPHQRS